MDPITNPAIRARIKENIASCDTERKYWITLLGPDDLSIPAAKVTRPKGVNGSGRPHWSTLPGNEAKAAAWKAKMVKATRKSARARKSA